MASTAAPPSTRDESIQAAKKKLKAYRAKQAAAIAAAAAAAAASSSSNKRASLKRPISLASSSSSSSPAAPITNTHARTGSHARRPSQASISFSPAVAAQIVASSAAASPSSASANAHKRRSSHIRKQSLAHIDFAATIDKRSSRIIILPPAAPPAEENAAPAPAAAPAQAPASPAASPAALPPQPSSPSLFPHHHNNNNNNNNNDPSSPRQRSPRNTVITIPDPLPEDENDALALLVANNSRRPRPQSLYVRPMAASPSLFSSFDSNNNSSSTPGNTPVGNSAGVLSASSLAASQSHPDGLGTLTELAEAEEEEDSDTARKQARRASLTPRPLKLKSRPASLFIPSGGLASAMAHRMGPIASLTTTAPASSTGSSPAASTDSPLAPAEVPTSLSLRDIPTTSSSAAPVSKRHSLLFTPRPLGAIPSASSSTASSLNAATNPSPLTRELIEAKDAEEEAEQSRARDASKPQPIITQGAEESAWLKNSPSSTPTPTMASLPGPLSAPTLDGEVVILPAPATATTAAAQAAVGTTTLRQGMRALRLGSIVSATARPQATASSSSTPSIMSPTLGATETIFEPMTAPPAASSSSPSATPALPAASSSPKLPQTAPPSSSSSIKTSSVTAGRRSSIIYRSSSNTTSATSSNFGMGVRRIRRNNTADSSASSISPPSSISTTHGGPNDSRCAADVSTITVPVATYEDMCARATQTDTVRRSLDRTARELAFSEGERLRATAALNEKAQRLVELEEKMQEATEQAEMLNEDVEGWKERCKAAEANLARVCAASEEKRLAQESAATRMQERILALTRALEQAGVKVPREPHDGAEPDGGAHSASSSSGDHGGKPALDRLDLSSVLRFPPSMGPPSPSIGISPGGYFGLTGTPSAAMATPALLRSATAASRPGSDGSGAAMSAGGGATPQFDPEATVRLLRDMRQQIFNLAGRLDFERKEHLKTKEELLRLQASAPLLAEKSEERDEEEQVSEAPAVEAMTTTSHESLVLPADGDLDIEAVAGTPVYTSFEPVAEADEIQEEDTKDQTAEDEHTAFTFTEPSFPTGTSHTSHLDDTAFDDLEAARASSSTPGLEYDHRPGDSFSNWRTVREKNAFQSGTFGFDDQLRSVEEGGSGDSLRDDVIRRRSDESSIESQGPASPAEFDLEAQGGDDDMYEDEEEEDDYDIEHPTPEMDLEYWNRPDVVRSWSLSRATAAAKKSRTRAQARAKKATRSAGGDFAGAFRAVHHRQQPSFDDFFGIMSEVRLPPLPTPPQALDMPPVYSQFEPAAVSSAAADSNSRFSLSGRITSWARPQTFGIMSQGVFSAGGVSAPSAAGNGGGLSRSASLQNNRYSRYGSGAAGHGRNGSRSHSRSGSISLGRKPYGAAGAGSGALPSSAAMKLQHAMPAQPKPAQPKRLSAMRPIKAFVDRRSVPMPQATPVGDLNFAFATVGGVGPLIQL